MSDAKFQMALEYARRSGMADGMGAARGAAIEGLERPEPDLSGEWADRTTGPELAKGALDYADYAHSRQCEQAGHGGEKCEYCRALDTGFNDICDAYEAAFDAAVAKVYASAG